MENTKGYNRIFAEVDVDAIRHNVMLVKNVKPAMMCLLVIKADAYGHGSVMLAKRLDDLADYYGVATIDEAVELRQAGIVKPILIIGYTSPADYESLIRYDITQAMYVPEDCKVLSELALSMGKKAKIHIKVDTGMSRIGFQVDDDSIKAAGTLADMKGLDIEGIFSHYARADEIDKTAAFIQKGKFKTFISGLAQYGIIPRIRHIDNSAGAMEMPDEEFDMFRLGISLYGLYPSEEIDKGLQLIPAMSLVSHVIHTKTVCSGTAIGYGGTYVADKEIRVATVAVGYADGYPRSQSNIGRVIVNGHYSKIVGRVCMDQIIIDITDIKNVNVGDEVVLFGSSGDCSISVEEVAKPANSFNYELVCNISRRVPRVYTQSGLANECINYLI